MKTTAKATLILAGLLVAVIAWNCGRAQRRPAEPETTAPAVVAGTPAQAAADPSPPRAAGIPLDLSYVDRKSAAYQRFKAWVDAAVAGNPGYAFSASDAAVMFRLTGKRDYCELAVSTVDKQVGEAEAAIRSGNYVPVSIDSYLYVGPAIAQLALTLDTCKDMVTAEQRSRWSAYTEQTVWNVWHHNEAKWGDRTVPWTGWATDNPGNNYYYSFLEATMYWALASGSGEWMQDLRQRRLPPLAAYFAKLPGGGSSEGTSYGTAHRHLFGLYRLWRDATGEDLANRNSHVSDTIPYWAHATVPTLDRYAPIGDQARYANPELFDYHRQIILEARQLTADERRRDIASWWLNHISVQRMSEQFMAFHDLLPAGKGGSPPDELIYHAEGAGHLFARTDWGRDAMWMSIVAGTYNESHAHQDQGAFTLFARDWLAVTSNIWTHSGINQGTQLHNVVRFERPDSSAQQCQAPIGERIVHQCYPSKSKLTWQPTGADGAFTATADMSGIYGDSPHVRRWVRKFDFAQRKLTVRDEFAIGPGARAVFQVHVAEEPKVDGNVVTSGRLRMRVLEPANPSISVLDWRTVDAKEHRGGWRIDVAGSDTGYLVELGER